MAPHSEGFRLREKAEGRGLLLIVGTGQSGRPPCAVAGRGGFGLIRNRYDVLGLTAVPENTCPLTPLGRRASDAPASLPRSHPPPQGRPSATYGLHRDTRRPGKLFKSRLKLSHSDSLITTRPGTRWIKPFLSSRAIALYRASRVRPTSAAISWKSPRMGTVLPFRSGCIWK